MNLRASVALLLRWWQQCEKYNLLPFGVYERRTDCCAIGLFFISYPFEGGPNVRG